MSKSINSDNRGMSRSNSLRTTIYFVVLSILLVVMFCACLWVGPVKISFTEIIGLIISPGDAHEVTKAIILDSRLPAAVCALLSGIGLSSAGLILQTVFRNPLAGPSILGISSGASMGVAIVMMGSAAGMGGVLSAGLGSYMTMLLGGIIGAGVVILLLLFFSSIVRNGVILLIIGILLSYLSSSLIAILDYFSPAEQLKNYTLWGLGSFTGVTSAHILPFALLILLICLPYLAQAKPLNALLLGERYAASMGYNVRNLRARLLLISGVLTAVVTSYCGPIGFIGMVVPHIARLLFSSSNHTITIPATILIGACVTLLCNLLSCGLIHDTQLPINIVTPIIGVPIILYILLRRNKIVYFN